MDEAVSSKLISELNGDLAYSSVVNGYKLVCFETRTAVFVLPRNMSPSSCRYHVIDASLGQASFLANLEIIFLFRRE